MDVPTKPRRHLTVLNNKDDDAPEERPAWHWVVLGGVAILLAWLMLAAIVNAIFANAGSRTGLVVNAVALLLSGVVGGAMIGKFGTRAAARHAALAGGVTAAFGCGLALRGSTGGVLVWIVTFVIAAALAVGGAALGFRLSRRRARA